jgi:hypothetical protein
MDRGLPRREGQSGVGVKGWAAAKGLHWGCRLRLERDDLVGRCDGMQGCDGLRGAGVYLAWPGGPG